MTHEHSQYSGEGLVGADMGWRVSMGKSTQTNKGDICNTCSNKGKLKN